MEENPVSSLLRGIGWTAIIIGVLGSVVLGAATKSFLLFVYTLIGCGLTGVLLIGFSEVISLLQQNYNTQEKILMALKANKPDKRNAPERTDTALEEIAPNADKTADVKATVHITSTSSSDIVCPNCGQVQPAKRNVCWKCGVSFAKDAPASE